MNQSGSSDGTTVVALPVVVLNVEDDVSVVVYGVCDVTDEVAVVRETIVVECSEVEVDVHVIMPSVVVELIMLVSVVVNDVSDVIVTVVDVDVSVAVALVVVVPDIVADLVDVRVFVVVW